VSRFPCRSIIGLVSITGLVSYVGANAHGKPGRYFFPYVGDGAIPATNQRAQGKVVLPDGKPGECLTDRLTDEADRCVRKNRDERFFL
jgi:hypothetical protein